MIKIMSKIELKKYGFLAGAIGAFFLIGFGVWIYVKDVPSSEPESHIEMSSIPSSSIGEDKEPEFSDASLNGPPLEPILEEEPSPDIFIEVKEGHSSDEKEKAPSSDFYFNQGVSYDKENKKEQAIEAYEKALLLSTSEPFHFSKEGVIQRLNFLKRSRNFSAPCASS